jgi:hypothetical protein
MDDEDDHSNDDVDSEFSDTDYVLSREELTYLKKQGISEDRAQHLWTKQRGLCDVTNTPVLFMKGVYGAEVVARRITEPVSDENSMIVCQAVAQMRDSINVSWTQFKSLVCQFGNGIE